MDHYYRVGPCANCGREGAGFMGSSEWGHDYSCCSDACGKRLAHKMRHGMGGPHEGCYAPWDGWENPFIGHDYDRLALRIRIKLLSHRLKNITTRLGGRNP